MAGGHSRVAGAHSKIPTSETESSKRFVIAAREKGRQRDWGGQYKVGLVDDFEAIFFDDRIGEDFFGDALELFLSFVAAPAVEIQDEEFSLADVFDGSVAEAGESMMDGLSLGIEDGALGHDPDVSFHGGIIALRRAGLSVMPKLVQFEF